VGSAWTHHATAATKVNFLASSHSGRGLNAYGEGYGVIDERPTAPGEELVTEGTGRTDDTGLLEVRFATRAPENAWAGDFQYRVVAEVTDLSRRTIEGAGNLKVTREPFYVNFSTPAWFYHVGDDVNLTLLAMNADDLPIVARGEVALYRLEWRPGEDRPVEHPVGAGAFAMDPRGEAEYSFTPEEPGQYLVRVQARGPGSDEVVKAEHTLNVAGEGFDQAAFRYSNLLIKPAKRDYVTGDTIQVLVGAPGDQARVWVAIEADNEILAEQWVELRGTGRVLEFKAERKHVPNFFVVAHAVVDGKVYQATREVFVPPAEEILDVTLTADRAEYLPRAQGSFGVQVRDSRGKPVAGEVGLHLFDASVLYIQAETQGDIRQYYYGARRANYLNVAHSAQVWLSSWWKDAHPLPDYNGPTIPDPGGGYRYGGWYDGHLRANLMGAFATGSAAGGGGMGLVAEEAKAEDRTVLRAQVAGARRMAMPAAAPAPEMAAKAAEAPGKKDKDANADQAGGEAGAGPAVTVRSEFPDSLVWEPFLRLDAQGRGRVTATFPDSLTTWSGLSVAVDAGGKVGLARVSVVTSRNLVARVETPRFLVEGDEVTLAAVITNRFADAEPVKLELAVEGPAEMLGEARAELKVEGGRDARHDFRLRALKPGAVTVTLTARGKREADALRKELPVVEWGAQKTVTQAAILKQPGRTVLELSVPDKLREGSQALTLDLRPTLSGLLVTALPYLIQYPYGCVEQTMSRFLPAAVVKAALKDLGMTLDEIRFPESDDPLDKLKPDRAPVLTQKELNRIVRAGLERLMDFQHGDGGWAWWKDGDSDPYMTAYVVSGLETARQAGVDLDQGALERGFAYLKAAFASQKKDRWWMGDHLRVYLAWVLSMRQRVTFSEVSGIYERRAELSDYSRAILGLTLWNLGRRDEAGLIVENLRDLAWIDAANGTASFKQPSSGWWWWWNNRVETVTWALRLFTTVKPGDPLADQFAKWLVMNREGNRWTSTRDTAFAVLALAEYMRAQKELDADYTARVRLDGKQVKEVRFTRANLFSNDGYLALGPDVLGAGTHRLEIERDGTGVLYATAFLTFFTREDKIKGAGNEVFVERTYYRLTPEKGQAQSGRGVIEVRRWAREKLEEGAQLKSGDRILVHVVIEARNDYEYLVFEDPKPAGAEPVELKSGGVWENGAWWNREYRDRQVVSFLSWLPQGKQTLEYQVRMEIPGTFHVLPHNAYAMYAPRVKAISDSALFRVLE
jgi:uncharacterized protein YfaS (alpha-2-macroglobulin family)